MFIFKCTCIHTDIVLNVAGLNEGYDNIMGNTGMYLVFNERC